jgi:hypothetical protein
MLRSVRHGWLRLHTVLGPVETDLTDQQGRKAREGSREKDDAVFSTPTVHTVLWLLMLAGDGRF